ncbi:helix-turn-helix domain-containing protein [Lacrimispora amygdalina]|uniref:Helix-turn-helix domain-containing protein n=1 Tax=Lacrimispora amygdalina TaxID=253257 RepID=A0A3E2NB80_9FIRM|nr:helix-turn-helix domain-containing protein [Clostridium indicum]RFZ78277.1 helix-turn-helix domain-containing protein [Clostridium indicum]
MSHKLKSVRALNDLILLAIFQDGTEKMYDIKQLFTVFPQLRELERSFDLFNGVQIDTGGYGVSWNDDLDLDAEEIWDNGINTEKKHLIDIKQSFATKLISAREICNITQRDLSKRAGITQGDISKIENGNANPSLSTLERLAEGLGMRIEFNFVGK